MHYINFHDIKSWTFFLGLFGLRFLPVALFLALVSAECDLPIFVALISA